MAFRFSLATVLRLREIAEEREERTLTGILTQMAQCQQKLSDLQAEHRAVLVRRDADLVSQMSAAELQFSHDQARAIESRQKSVVDELRKLDLLRQQQLKVYEDAHRHTELLTDLRESKRDLFLRERVRQEQNAMDDNFSARRTRN